MSLSQIGVTACTLKGLKQDARQDALWFRGVQRLDVEASTLSFSGTYTVTIGRYYCKHKDVSLYNRILVNNVIACVKN